MVTMGFLGKSVGKSTRIQYRILVMLAFFSISAGLWENFRQLWLEQNGFSATEISNLISFGTLISVVGILLVGRFVKMAKIKYFMLVTLILRLLNMLGIFGLYDTASRALIDGCIIVDVLTAYLIITSIYPLLTTVAKSNTVYSRRKLVEYLFRDVGILIGGLTIGRQFGALVFDYNGCLLISALLLVVAFFILYFININPTERSDRQSQKFSVTKFVLRSKLQRTYMCYSLLSSASFATAVGLKMLILTNIFDFSASTATNYLLLVGLLADGIGILALKFFTPRNDYLTMTLKFGIRLVAMIIAVLTDNTFICFLAFTWIILSSTAYENVSDGYYINIVDNRFQLKYNTLKYVVSITGEAIGIFLCGRMYNFGISHILGLAAAITVVQLIVAYYLIFIRQRAGASRPRKHRLG